MTSGPIANYVYSPWEGKPGAALGYDAVGPGWRSLLEILDTAMLDAVRNAVTNATVAREEFREEGNTAEAAVEILQVKEKFGGLRVYFQTRGMSRRWEEYLRGAVDFAERMSLRTCEKCGSTEHFRGAVETRNKKDSKYGRILTLCGGCHEERDNMPAGQWFKLGNGDLAS